MLKKVKNKNLKPIDVDGHLQYRCPNCAIDHWLSFKEARTKGFICVCDCGITFSVKRVLDLKIIFKHKKPISQSATIAPESIQKTNTAQSCVEKTSVIEIPVELLEKSTKVLIGFGFTKTEAISMLKETYSVFQTENVALLVKKAIAKIGELNG